MAASYYEAHQHPNPKFPVIFRCDTFRAPLALEFIHWHESVELLYCCEGNGVLLSDSSKIPFRAGEIAVANSGCLHTVHTTDYCKYYCIIVEFELFSGLGLPVEQTSLTPLIRDEEAESLFCQIARIIEKKERYHQVAARGTILTLFALLYKRYPMQPARDSGQESYQKIDLTKKAIGYIRQHYAENIAIQDICTDLGISKSHLCHVFREMSGKTVVEYINLLRCTHARNLLTAGSHTVSESAWQSGFHNLSYFTRTYKQLMNELPSETKCNNYLQTPVTMERGYNRLSEHEQLEAFASKTDC